METVFIKIVNRSISAGWLVLAVIAARWILKKAPKWISVTLWGLVGLRLVMPFTIRTGFSLLPSAEVISPFIGYAKNPTISSGISVFDNAVNPVLGASLAANLGDSVNPMQVWLFVFSIVWIAGAALLLTCGFVNYLRLYQKVSEAALLQENVWVCDQVETPFILGILRPRIYLPSSLEEKDMGYVLSHERAHLRRKDHIWKPIGFLLLSIYWFNPLLWAAYILLCRDIELACDEKVISDMETSEKKAYAKALVSCSMQRRLVLACPPAFGETGVKERVKGVLNYKKPALGVTAFAIVICAVIAICFLTNPVQTSSYNDQSDIDHYRTDYIGDASKVSQIAMRLPYPGDYSYSSIEIQSAQEPYGLTVYLNGNQALSPDKFEEAARVAFDHIGNMGTVRFCRAGTKEEFASFVRGEIKNGVSLPDDQ